MLLTTGNKRELAMGCCTLYGDTRDEIEKKGGDGSPAARIIRTTARAEFKRRQAPLAFKVSPRAFGMGRRMPIAQIIYEV
jgi:NAD+ synthase (glutamine-hydrolysing)